LRCQKALAGNHDDEEEGTKVERLPGKIWAGSSKILALVGSPLLYF
jgi:hypothetical protein